MPSLSEELAALPKQREHTHDVKGLVLFLPRTGLIVVPVEMRTGGYWRIVVVSTEHVHSQRTAESYPRQGYDLVVSPEELRTAIECKLVIP